MSKSIIWQMCVYLTMSLCKRSEVFGVLLSQLGLNIVPQNCKTLAAQLLKLPEEEGLHSLRTTHRKGCPESFNRLFLDTIQIC